MPGKIYLINVGANASHRFASPVFQDGRFEFLPIPEDRNLPEPHGIKYRDLRSHYDTAQYQTRYVPPRLWDQSAHADPEFDTFTYGDNCAVSPRAASLRKVERGDFLFFIARVERWVGDRPTAMFGFCLIGFLEVEDLLREVTGPLEATRLKRFQSNAHVKRGLSDSRLWDGFWIFAGSNKSRRFYRAVPVTRELADRVFTTADGTPWHWDKSRTDLQIIGSYTRSCRCVIDPDMPDHTERIQFFWDWIESWTNGAPIDESISSPGGKSCRVVEGTLEYPPKATTRPEKMWPQYPPEYRSANP